MVRVQRKGREVNKKMLQRAETCRALLSRERSWLFYYKCKSKPLNIDFYRERSIISFLSAARGYE